MRDGMKFEGGCLVKGPGEVILIHKQDVKFLDPPPAKTKKAENEKHDQMIRLILESGFTLGLNSPEEMFLVVEDGLAIGIFRSLAEIHNYVRKGYPATDIKKHKADMLANGRPEDFHKLPVVIREDWDNLPEELRQRIREEGVDAAEFRMVVETTCGKEVIHPSAKFHAKPIKPAKTEEERELEFKRHLLYINDTGFEVNGIGDDEICIEVDSAHVIGPFPSLALVCQYLEEEHHLADIQFIRDKGNSTSH